MIRQIPILLVALLLVSPAIEPHPARADVRVGDSSLIYITTDASCDLLLVGPDWDRTGWDRDFGEFVNEIPGSEYFCEEIEDPDGGGVMEHYILEIRRPSTGDYRVYLTAPEHGLANITILMRDSRGDFEQEEFVVKVGPGRKPTEILVQYDKRPGSNQAVFLE
jgi:hypothetical protein